MACNDCNKANWQGCVSLHWVNPWRAGCQLGGSSWQEASETAGGLGLSRPVLSPRGRCFFEQVVAWVEKVGDSPHCPFLPASGIILVSERLLTAYDLLSSADNTLQLGVRARGGLLIDRSGGHLSISTNYD